MINTKPPLAKTTVKGCSRGNGQKAGSGTTVDVKRRL
jgi:hypothetical protein